MAVNNQNNNDSTTSVLFNAASAAGMAKSALKTGKAIAGMSKGAAAGPYGMIAAGLWENRKIIGKILAAVGCVLLIPVLYIMMLPSLIFGTGGMDNADGDVLNDTDLIMENIAETETSIETILREKHDALLADIQDSADKLGKNCEYSITDEFADRIIYESALIISQFCASQDDYQEINLTKLEKILRDNLDDIFSYTTNVTSYDETDEDTGKTTTITHYEYVVHYAGNSYFADNVFYLTDEQLVIANEYASNLHIFLYDTVYDIHVNPDLVPGETGNAAVDLALTKLGTPYSQERRNEDGYFDCSSFTYWVYSQLDVYLQYDGANTAAAQGRYIADNDLVIAYDSLSPGDLIFYSFEVNHRFLNISHVAIYAGDGYVVDASSSKGKVVYRPIYDINNIVLCGRPYTN